MSETKDLCERRRFFLVMLQIILLGIILGLASCNGGGSAARADFTNQLSSGGEPVPDIINLPVGFRPEGIFISGSSLYVGSIPTGRIFRADIMTGQGEILVEPGAGRSAIGLKVDGKGRIFSAGGQTGKAFVYDAGTGAELATYPFAEGNTFINDVVVTSRNAWFTDSANPVLYGLTFGPDGSLPAPEATKKLNLTGDFQFMAGQFNANGITATRDGSMLIIVQSNTGKLFLVNPESGITREISLGADSVLNGDGILLDGQTIFVVQNRLNQLAVIALSTDLTTGQLIRVVTDPNFDVPTTVTDAGKSLYLVNARFGIADPNTAQFNVVRINKP